MKLFTTDEAVDERVVRLGTRIRSAPQDSSKQFDVRIEVNDSLDATVALFNAAVEEGKCCTSYRERYVVNEGTSVRTPGNESFSVSLR